MSFTTRMTLPARDVSALTALLTQAGFTVLDQGERITTDEGPDHEAALHVARFDIGAEITATRA